MRSFTEIKRDNRVRLVAASADPDTGGFSALVRVGKSHVRVIASWGGDWDHVSVSREDRIPRWEEMEAVKRIMFDPNETVMQLHPPIAQYVNDNPNVLHLWKPHGVEIPLPPRIFV